MAAVRDHERLRVGHKKDRVSTYLLVRSQRFFRQCDALRVHLTVPPPLRLAGSPTPSNRFNPGPGFGEFLIAWTCDNAVSLAAGLPATAPSLRILPRGGRVMTGAPRNTGIDPVGNKPWGTHFCHFYETTDDLL